jgi:folate-binding protein YgfZ
VDALDDDLPQEGGFGGAVAVDKGCYLGQEAVAKVRNLGHPRRVLVHVRAGAPVRAGDAVRAGDQPVGEITSAARDDDRWWALAKVRWRDRATPLATTEGVSLTLV